MVVLLGVSMTSGHDATGHRAPPPKPGEPDLPHPPPGDLGRRKSSTGEGKQITSGFAYWGIAPTIAWAQVRVRLADTPFHYVSLGVGTGHKDRSILQDLLGPNPGLLYSLLGKTMANFDEDIDLLDKLTRLLRPQDRFLLEVATTASLDEHLADHAAEEYGSWPSRRCSASRGSSCRQVISGGSPRSTPSPCWQASRASSPSGGG